MIAKDIEQIVQRTTLQTLESLGFDLVDHDGRRELRADLAHLRRWRTAVDKVSARAMLTLVTVIVTGVMGWLWMLISTALHLKWPGH